MTTVVYIIKFSDAEKILSKEELQELAILWDGEVTKNGDIITEEYPEDYSSNEEYFPIYASWDEYKGDYSQVEKWEIPVPTREEYVKAVLAGEYGEYAQKGLLNEQATWEMVQFIPAHRAYEQTWSHSSGSSDGYRSGGRSTVSRGYVSKPDTWVWVSSTGMTQELPSENHRPRFKTNYSYEWYCEQVKNAYIEAYNKRKAAWMATNVVKIKKPAAAATAKAKEEAAKRKEVKHPLASKRSGYPDLKKYFYSLYPPELQEYQDYIQLCMWPSPNAVFQHRKCGVHYEQLKDTSEYIYKFNENKKVDEICLPVKEILERAEAFKAYADKEVAKYLAAKEEAAKEKSAKMQQQQAYEAYKKAQQDKKLIVKPFEKWLLTIG